MHLQEYLILLARLEHQFVSSPTFTLQQFWYYLHPSLHTLSLLGALTSDLVSLGLPSDNDDADSDASTEDGNEALKGILDEMRGAAKGIAAANAVGSTGVATGGEVLHVIAEKLERKSGDPVARELYSMLLLRASQPYVTILLGWISTGHLSDPWDEFIVKEARNINRGSLEMDYTDEYWDRRYTLRDKGVKKAAPATHLGDPAESPRSRGLSGGAVVPKFLQPWRTKILLAGKYLNVIRECGIEIAVPRGAESQSNELVAMNEEA